MQICVIEPFVHAIIWLIFAWTVLNGLIVSTGLKGVIVTTFLKYSSFRPFSVFHELHTAIIHVIIVLKKQSLACHNIYSIGIHMRPAIPILLMIHNLYLPLSFYLCDLRWTRLHWGGLSSHLPSWIHQGKLQHPHYRWWYLWDWRDLLPYTGDPPTSSGHWCHEGWPVHGYRHHYRWWWWVFCNIIPTHLHIQCSQLPTVTPRPSCSVNYIYFVSWLTAQVYCGSPACGTCALDVLNNTFMFISWNYEYV